MTGLGGTTTYGFDDASGQLASVTAPDGGVFGFSWDPAGRLEQMTRPNDVSDVLAWNEQGLLASRTQVDADGSRITGVAYGYDAGGRRTSVRSLVYDAANRLVRGAKHDYTHDAEGNLASRTVRATGAITRYEWDSEHRLVG